KELFLRYAYMLVPMGLLAWIAFSFPLIMVNGSYIVSVLSDPMGTGWDLFGTANFPWTPVLTAWLVPIQLAVLIGGFLVSADYGYKLSRQTYGDGAAARRGFLPLLVFLTGVTVLFGWLYGG
ncbi:hypothetical protein LCGC14_1961190, partial [marine sediment metagenome]